MDDSRALTKQAATVLLWLAARGVGCEPADPDAAFAAATPRTHPVAAPPAVRVRGAVEPGPVSEDVAPPYLQAAVVVMDKIGGCLSMLFTDVNLAGMMNGVELAAIARKRFPNLKVIVTSGNVLPTLPPNTLFLQKPWRALEVIREAERLAA